MRPRVDLPLLSTGRGRLLSVKPGCRVRASWLLTNPHHIQTSYKSHRLPLNTRATEVRSIVSDSQLLCQDQHWRNPERHSKDDWNSDPTPISGLFYPVQKLSSKSSAAQFHCFSSFNQYIEL
ncbi:hypothetical protein MJO28_014839 [Puccinia striiformis f. sp. tritici]|uniref:Uncharacterized protein n=1 Tax=Puccinia striiformis f. sp. tritici TaxID=168172 RepID=A0ACC0DSB4_9BASI|nr:hypothetical protein MJO28_014839 [Puccinia striiformis f. sp. tritici]